MENGHKIVVRIKGGLGNQLFGYCAARRLAYVNDAQLVIDNVTGLLRNSKYPRLYNLKHFNITAPLAKSRERLYPFERIRRYVLKIASQLRPFPEMSYILENGNDFDSRLLELTIKKDIHLDGYWQSEGYFKDIEQIIRSDLIITPPADSCNTDMYHKIRNCTNAVAIHVRWFEPPGIASESNVSSEYYKKAIAFISMRAPDSHYFVFSEDMHAALQLLELPESKFTPVTHNSSAEMAYADLWLMTQCKHFIIANSTFSWWGAWLGNYTEKIVVCPNMKKSGLGAWGFKGLIPHGWVKL